MLGSSCEKESIQAAINKKSRQEGGLTGKFSEAQVPTDIDEKMVRGISTTSTQRAESLADNNIKSLAEKLTKRREKKIMPRTSSQPSLDPSMN